MIDKERAFWYSSHQNARSQHIAALLAATTRPQPTAQPERMPAMSRPVHFEVHVDDFDRAKQFYGQTLGWRFERMPDPNFEYWFAFTGDPARPGIDGALTQRWGSPPSADAATTAYVCIMEVDDLDALIAAVPQAGGEIALPKMAVAGTGWLAYFKDTEGNTFGAMQPDPQAGM